MTLKEVFENYSLLEIKKAVKDLIDVENIEQKNKDAIDIICVILKQNLDLVPKAGSKSIQPIVAFVNKYVNGCRSRASMRIGKKSATIPDKIINTIIITRYPELTAKNVENIVEGHKIAMVAENILGYLLEEYIYNSLPSDWYCCWGETIKSVDFVSSSGKLLQIKNRSNSENSSSSSVRKGTTIEKWYRVNATTGETNWQKLNEIVAGMNASEAAFVTFVKQTLTDNPECMFG